MKDRMPSLTKKNVPFEQIKEELEAPNAISYGSDSETFYVSHCEDRGGLNCSICGLNEICSKSLKDCTSQDFIGTINHPVAEGLKDGELIGECSGVVVGIDRAGVVVEVNPDPITCRTCIYSDGGCSESKKV